MIEAAKARGEVRLGLRRAFAALAVYGALEEILTGWVLGQLPARGARRRAGVCDGGRRRFGRIGGVTKSSTCATASSRPRRRPGRPAVPRCAASSEASWGAALTGCSVYELEPGSATWPYHFELTEEEWLIVIDGELTVRTPEGERVLRVGDVVCFPAGAAGAHAVSNPGSGVARFAMLVSRMRHGGGCGVSRRGQGSTCIRTGSNIAVDSVEPRRLLGGRGDDVNLFDVEVQTDEDDPDGYHTSYRPRRRRSSAASQLGAVGVRAAAGQSICPYHYETGEEEWLIVLTGRPTLRTPDGEQELGPWDCAFFPAGEAGRTR